MPLSFFAGLFSSFFAYFLNKMAVKIFKERAVYTVVPFIEESLKTLLGFFIGGSILISHFVFGLCEALYDFYKGDRKVNFRASLMSVLSHILFGIMTILLIGRLGGLVLPILAVSFFHCLWNKIAIK